MNPPLRKSADKCRNIGIDAVKIAACYAVCSLHFGSTGFARRLAVPAFMFLSFYLSRKLFDFPDCASLLRRIKRLSVPYLFWGIAGIAFAAVGGVNVCARNIFTQLFLGEPYAGHMWYVASLMIVTFFVFAVERYAPYKVWIYAVAVLLCFVFQYAGWNHALFGKIAGMERFTLGRTAEMLPLAVAGLTFSRIENIFARRTGLAVLAFVAVAASSAIAMLFTTLPPGFGYQGLFPALMCMSLCASMIIAGKIIGCRFESRFRTVELVAEQTPGIYFSHVLIGEALIRYGGFSKSNLLPLLVFVLAAIFISILRSNRLSKNIVG